MVGLVFYIFADLILENEFIRHDEEMHDHEEEPLPDTFITTNGLFEFTPVERCLRVFYFMFTTLSTVGFGDFHPRADAERIFVVFILLLGVAVFSYFMGNFVEIIKAV